MYSKYTMLMYLYTKPTENAEFIMTKNLPRQYRQTG